MPSSNNGLIWSFKKKGGLEAEAKAVQKWFLKHFPKEKDQHFFQHTYTYRLSNFNGRFKKYIELFSYLDISPDETNHLYQLFYSVSNPDANRTKKDYEQHMFFAIRELKRTDEIMTERLKMLSRIECIRLYEAMRCLDMQCNLSSVVMAVSAVEYRLHQLFAKTSPKLYKKEFQRATLGGIIEVFRINSTRYTASKYNKLKKILPEKHRPLMEMLNVYRIFSAHPKDEVITTQTAKAILSLAFLLLIDEVLRV